MKRRFVTMLALSLILCSFATPKVNAQIFTLDGDEHEYNTESAAMTFTKNNEDVYYYFLFPAQTDDEEDFEILLDTQGNSITGFTYKAGTLYVPLETIETGSKGDFYKNGSYVAKATYNSLSHQLDIETNSQNSTTPTNPSGNESENANNNSGSGSSNNENNNNEAGNDEQGSQTLGSLIGSNEKDDNENVIDVEELKTQYEKLNKDYLDLKDKIYNQSGENIDKATLEETINKLKAFKAGVEELEKIVKEGSNDDAEIAALNETISTIKKTIDMDINTFNTIKKAIELSEKSADSELLKTIEELYTQINTLKATIAKHETSLLSLSLQIKDFAQKNLKLTETGGVLSFNNKNLQKQAQDLADQISDLKQQVVNLKAQISTGSKVGTSSNTTTTPITSTGVNSSSVSVNTTNNNSNSNVTYSSNTKPTTSNTQNNTTSSTNAGSTTQNNTTQTGTNSTDSGIIVNPTTNTTTNTGSGVVTDIGNSTVPSKDKTEGTDINKDNKDKEDKNTPSSINTDAVITNQNNAADVSTFNLGSNTNNLSNATPTVIDKNKEGSETVDTNVKEDGTTVTDELPGEPTFIQKHGILISKILFALAACFLGMISFIILKEIKKNKANSDDDEDEEDEDEEDEDDYDNNGNEIMPMPSEEDFESERASSVKAFKSSFNQPLSFSMSDNTESESSIDIDDF